MSCCVVFYVILRMIEQKHSAVGFKDKILLFFFLVVGFGCLLRQSKRVS
jgi:hypothetical protein